MTMIPQYRPEGGTIAQLLMRRGDVAADAAMRSGQIWGNAVGQLGQIAGGAIQQYQQGKEEQKREAAFGEALSAWNPADPRGSVMRLASVIGPQDAMKFGAGLMSFEAMVQKNAAGEVPSQEEVKAGLIAANVLAKSAPGMFTQQYPVLRQQFGPALKQHFGIELPEQPTPEIMQGLDALAAEWGAKGEDKPMVVGGRLVRPTATGANVLYEPPAEPKEPPKSLADIEAEAAARARGTASVKPADEKGTWTQAEDEKGNPVLLNATTGAVKPYPAGVIPKPAATEANRIAASEAALTVSGTVRDYIKKNKDVLGLLLGRYNSILQAVGAGDPVATKLMGELKSYSALQPQIHGFRNVQFVNQIEDLINIKQSPETLIAAIEGIDSAAKAVTSRGRKSDDEEWTEMPGGIRIREKKK